MILRWSGEAEAATLIARPHPCGVDSPTDGLPLVETGVPTAERLGIERAVLRQVVAPAGIEDEPIERDQEFGEGRVPWGFTGSAVGLVSLIGYTPDVFMGPLMGFLTDRSPGAAGHRHLYLVVAAFGVAGGLATLAFRRATRAPRPARV